ncbi:tetratricopeptide repeat protein [Leptolyngbya sp. CCNP1308]|uniref:tetratricopeptide repeat protein n=1 Tax=Leptolyngbya sp. CCNP1308 TaxID=3110255 RepID=UPI002B21818A|nr:tetratricopeptide repeat protein [Leptolyngbya sp. CCNP1308]MEA5449603.1 tetratricopeptide repeat protein [Leptolyngbya sp. CCNP1308]
MSLQRRLTLFQTLSALPAPQFEQLRFTLNPPPGIVPEGMAAQGNRVAALLSWVEGATGCGLERLYEVLEQLCPGCLGDGEGGGDRGEPPWLVPYGRNPYFTGRDQVLATLHQQLRDRQTAAISQTQAISGLGGIGKTQTAVEYAYRYRDDYRYVFWVGADTELELTTGYVAIAQTLNLPLKDAENQDETVQSVRVWLSREEGWLLIFDNADQPELVQPFLPREIKGHILVTSRAQDFQDLGIVQAVEMETLNPEEAIAFLLTRTGRINLVGALAQPSQRLYGIRPTPGTEPLADNPDGQSALRQGSIPPTPLEKGGSRPGAGADNSFPPLVRGARGDQISDIEQSAATALAAELGYLPLALEQAAAYIVTNRVSFTDYLNSYRKQRLKRLEKAKPKLGHYPDSVATTWALNLKEVQKAAPAAAALLNYCAFLHPDAIPFNLFTQGAAELGEPLATALADAADDPLELYDLLNSLCSYSLVRVEPESQSFSLHRLVQEVIRVDLGEDSCQNWVEPLFRAMGQLLPGKDEDLEYHHWPVLAPLVNHVQELANHCQQRDIASTEAADVFHTMGEYLLERGQYALAEPLLQKALELRRNLLGNEHKDVANSLDSLGYISRITGRYAEAEPLSQAALAMRKRLLGHDHSSVAISLTGLGELYREQGRYREAETSHQEALALRERLLGKEHPGTVTSLSNLALTYWKQGRYVEAEKLFQETLALDKKLLGNDHPYFATSLNNLALVYCEQNRYCDAVPLFQQALKIRQQVFGLEHSLVAQSLDNLASTYYLQSRIDEAESLYQQAFVLYRKLFGNEHPDVAHSLSNLAKIHNNQGRYSEAEPFFQEALAMRKRLLGDEHPSVAISLNNLAMFYYNQGRYSEAELLYQDALAMRKQLLGDAHPNVALSLNNLAALYRDQGLYNKAEPYLSEALQIWQQSLGEDHPNVGRVTENLGILYATQGRAEEARSLYQQALAILEPKLGAEHPWTVRCRENLAKVENGE